MTTSSRWQHLHDEDIFAMMTSSRWHLCDDDISHDFSLFPSHDFSLFPSHDLYLYITFFFTISLPRLPLPSRVVLSLPSHSSTHSLSLSPSFSRSHFLSHFPVHALFHFILALHRLHSLSLLSLSHDLSPVSLSISLLLLSPSLPHDLSFSLSKISPILLSHCLTFSSSLRHSLSVALATISPSHPLLSHHLTQLLSQFPSFAPKSLLPLWRPLILPLQPSLSLLFLDLALSFLNISPSIPFSFAIHNLFPPSLFYSLKHYFPSCVVCSGVLIIQYVIEASLLKHLNGNDCSILIIEYLIIQYTWKSWLFNTSLIQFLVSKS